MIAKNQKTDDRENHEEMARDMWRDETTCPFVQKGKTHLPICFALPCSPFTLLPGVSKTKFKTKKVNR